MSLRSLPASRFPALAALGAYAWADDRDQRFTASLDTLIAGLRATLRSRTRDCLPASSSGTRPVSSLRWPGANIPAAAVIVLVIVMMAAQIAD